MKNLPLGIQTFEKVIEGNYLYVDKTKALYELISNDDSYYFISRPRRFGKSLLVSTLKEIFSGNKELFKDLWIYDKIEWETYPVVHIDFSSMDFRSPEIFLNSFNNIMIDLLKYHNLEIDEKKSYKEKFSFLLKEISKQKKIVLLIDEYDKPIIDFVENDEYAAQNKEILKNFYETIKASDQYIRFVFLTGVSKFSKVSVFSGLNNLRDITLEDKFSTLMGYTEEELFSYFNEHITLTAEKLNVTSDYLKETLKKWYNGYSWDGKSFVYNPYSILSVFTVQKINNYWFTSGTPTFLIKMIKEYNVNLSELEAYETDETVFDSFEIGRMNVQSLLFQTGYLTIKKISELTLGLKEYILTYPNVEVKESLLKNILADFSNKNGETGIIINKMARALNKDKTEEFFNHLKSLFADIPNHIFIGTREAYYQTIIYLTLALLGIRIKVEVHTNKGRTDAVIYTDNKIYIVEFKMGTAEKAMQQIEEKKYYQPFISSGKNITLLGVGFDVEERNIGSYLVKEL